MVFPSGHMLLVMKRFLLAISLVLLFACVSAPSNRGKPLRWPHLPPRATFRGSILFQTQMATHRGEFLLRYTPDSVAFLVKGVLGFSWSFRGRREEAPPELQALLGLVDPEFCGPARICTPAGTLEVQGSPLPSLLEIPGLLRVKILEWRREGPYEIPVAWLFEGEEGKGKAEVTDFRAE